MKVEYDNQDINCGDLLFVQNNKVFLENRASHGRVARFFLSVFGGRDYSLESVLAKHDIEYLSKKQAKKCGLEATIIDVLNDPTNEKNVDYLKPELNGKLAKFMKTAGKQWTQEKKGVMKTLLAYTHKVKSLQRFKDLKIDQIDLDNLDGRQKMSLKDLRLIESMEKAVKLNTTIERWGVDVAEFKVQAELAQRFSKDVRKRANAEMEQQPFRIVCYDFDTVQELYGKKKMEQVVGWVLFQANVSHVSIAYPTNARKMHEAHMWGEPSLYNHGEMPLSSYPYTTISVNFEKSLTDEQKGDLQTHYGDNYILEIQGKFRAILEKNYSGDDYKDLKNPSWRRLVGFFKTRNNPFQSWRDQLEFDESREVFCSEFTAKTLLKAFVELERQLRDEMGNQEFSIEPPINTWRRIGNVFPSTLGKKARDPRYTVHQAPKIIQDLFDIHQPWLTPLT